MKISFSTDGKNWHDLSGELRYFVINHAPIKLNAGLISMRWPAWLARFWNNGRQIDGKRAGKTSLKNSVKLEKPVIYSGGSN